MIQEAIKMSMAEEIERKITETKEIQEKIKTSENKYPEIEEKPIEMKIK
jgi:hypothetical protein